MLIPVDSNLELQNTKVEKIFNKWSKMTATLSKIIPGSTCKKTQDKLLSHGLSRNDYVITYES